MDETQIIILAAGKGSRMGGDLPKAITPLGNQTMVEYVLDTVESLNMTYPPIVVVGYKSEMVMEVLGNRAIYAIQDEQKGTGHAVMCAMPHIDPEATRIVILYADQPFVSSATIQSLVELERSHDDTLTIATASISDDTLFHEQFYNFGRIIRDEHHAIIGIVESKDASDVQKKIREVNPAYFCCNKQWLAESLLNLKNNNAQGEYYLTDLVATAFGQQIPVNAISINEKEALGANTPEQLALLTTYLHK